MTDKIVSNDATKKQSGN